jgi:hypothetical protein
MKRYKVEIICNGYCALMTDDRSEAINLAKEAKKDDIRCRVWDYAASMTIYRNWISGIQN